MTPIEAAMDMAIKAAREDRESHGEEFDGNAPTKLYAFRGEELIATIVPEAGPNRDDMINCAFLAAQGFGVDILGLTFETFITKRRCNPATNRRWGPNELADVAENHGGREKGWVIDAIQVMAYNRAGDSRGANMAYRIVDDAVQWVDGFLPDDGQHNLGWGGYVHERLLAMMSEQSLPQFLGSLGITADNDGMSPEEQQAMIDITVAGVFSGRKFTEIANLPRAHVALAAQVGTRRAEMLAEADLEMHGES